MTNIKRNEIYNRMLILLLPYIDYGFFYNYSYKINILRKSLILSIENHSHVFNLDVEKNNISFYYSKDEYYLADFYEQLFRLSESLLTFHNNQIVVDVFDYQMKQDDILQPFENKILPYIEINKLMSDSLLVAAYCISYNYNTQFFLENNISHNISVIDYQLDSILNKGIAETHTHIFGSIPFEIQWIWIENHANDGTTNIKELIQKIDEQEEIHFHKNRLHINCRLDILLLTSSIIRVLFLSFFIYKNHTQINNFKSYIHILCDSINEMEIKDYLLKLLFFYETGKIELELNMTLNRKLINSIGKVMFKDFDEKDNVFERVFYFFIKNDYKISLSEKSKNIYNNEIEFVLNYECLKYIKETNYLDDKFSMIFMQYIRIKNLFHNFINQSSDVKGFIEFQLFFKNQHILIDNNELMYKPIFDTYSYEKVKYLEMRIGHIRFKQKDKDMVELDNIMVSTVTRSFLISLKKFANEYLHYLNNLDNENQFVKAAIVMHFNKREDDLNKCWIDYLRYQDNSLIRYKAYREECFINLAILQYIRSKIKHAEKYIVGIDAASNEFNTEPWVLAPIFRSIKDKWQYELDKRMGEYGLKCVKTTNLGVTYHVGEVFNSLLSGLRHVDEVVDYYGFQNGERLGHGTVLGVNIEDYINNKQIISIPAIELLDNWLYVYHLKNKENLFRHISMSYIEAKIWRLIRFIYADKNNNIPGNINIFHLYESYVKQFQNFEINKKYLDSCTKDMNNKGCYFSKKETWNSDILLYTRHCVCFLKKMNSIIQVDINNELYKSIYEEVQIYLRKKIAERGIIVEINPISNLLIGDITTIFEHPVLNLNNTYKDQGITDHIMVTINTDNPGIFGTTLKNQFGFIEQILLNEKVSKEKVLSWIDMIRKNGLNSTFINERNIDINDLKNELNEMVESIDNELKM